MDTGYVYIMINPYFKENIVKVGQTMNIEKRIKDLSHSSGIPTPFEVYALMKTIHYVEVEKTQCKLHKRYSAMFRSKTLPLNLILIGQSLSRR